MVWFGKTSAFHLYGFSDDIFNGRTMRREARGKKLVCGSGNVLSGVPGELEASAAWPFKKYPPIPRRS
jgi:hypothetical protein